MRTLLYVFLNFLLIVGFIACDYEYAPKPRGYFRILFPEKKYQVYHDSCPYQFDYPAYAFIVPDRSSMAKPYWINIVYPEFGGKIHLSYQPITSKKVFNNLVEDARTFTFKHTVKATAIDESMISYPDKKVHGILYTVDGNAASSIQFFLTDSVKNYVRCALYFNTRPQLDSIQPVIDFIRKDIDRMIKSFKWKTELSRK